VHSGTTLSSSIQSFVFSEGLPGSPRQNAYNFPYLGGGLSGDVLAWVAERDNLPQRYYTSNYTNTTRDPRENLKLKVSGQVNLTTYRDPANYNPTLTEPSQINANNRMIIDLAFVKSLSGIGPSGANAPTCSTSLTYNKHTTMLPPTAGNSYSLLYPRTAGLRINGGSFAGIYLQPYETYFFSTLIPYTGIGDYGIYLNNVTAYYLECQKKQSTYLRGCTFGWAKIDQYGWGGINTGTNTGSTYNHQAPIEIASNFSFTYTERDILGTTFNVQTSPYKDGLLRLSGQAVQFVSLPYTFPPVGQAPSTVLNPNSRNSQTVQQAVLGDRFSSATTTIPTIQVESPAAGLHYMPWGVEVAGTMVVDYIKNNAGVIQSNDDMSDEKSITCTLLDLSNHGVLDLGRNQMNFDDWRFGGISGNTIIGGIGFEDETGSIQGSNGVRLWNTQTRGKRIDARNGFEFPSEPMRIV
jgi:hypothetical protein